jgi:hypothetical protein
MAGLDRIRANIERTTRRELRNIVIAQLDRAIR